MTAPETPPLRSRWAAQPVHVEGGWTTNHRSAGDADHRPLYELELPDECVLNALSNRISSRTPTAILRTRKDPPS